MLRLVGQYDSPFVRRAAIALGHHRAPFKRHVISVFQDFGEMLRINPLGKVPALILPDGQCIYDSRAIIEYIESEADPGTRLTLAPDEGYAEMLRIEAVGIGLAEKTYERGIEFARRAPGTQDPAWVARLECQIETALNWLEARKPATFFLGGRLSRADLAVAVAATYLSEKLPQLFDRAHFPMLEAHRSACEALPIFQAAAYSRDEALATGWRPEKT